MNWDAVTAMSTLVGSAVLTVTAILAYRQLAEIKRARWVESMTKVFDMLINPEVSAARRYIRNHPLPAPGEHSDEVFDKMYRVWVSFDNLGVMIANNMLPKDVAFEMFHGSIIDCWNKLAPHIEYERSRRRDRYQVFFEHIACLSLEYKQKYASGDINRLNLRRMTRAPQ